MKGNAYTPPTTLSPSERVLLAITQGHQGLGDISRHTGLPVTKVRTVLRALAQSNVVESYLENRPVRLWKITEEAVIPLKERT